MRIRFISAGSSGGPNKILLSWPPISAATGGMLGSMKLVCSGLANRITMRRVENTASDLPLDLFVFLFYLPCSPCCWTLPPFRSGLFRAASWGGFFVNFPSFPSQRDRKRGGMEKQKAVVDETRLQRAQKDCRLELEGQGKQRHWSSTSG